MDPAKWGTPAVAVQEDRVMASRTAAHTPVQPGTRAEVGRRRDERSLAHAGLT